MGQFSEKTVLLTGANRGIGKALLEAFSKEGATVIALVRNAKDESYLNYIKSLQDKYEASVSTHEIDLTDSEKLTKLLKEIIKTTPQIDVVINNAGIAYGAPFVMTSYDKLKEVFEVNFFAPVTIMQLMARKMIKQGSGSIINMASVGGIGVNPGYLAYGSSKSSLIFATECLSKEVGLYGVRVNAVAPGLIDTSMGHYKNETELNKVIDRTSLRKMGTVDDVVSICLYLASDKAKFITGQTIRVDGGR